MPDLNINATFPGELVIAALIDLIREGLEGATPQQKEQLWQWFIEDYGKFRKVFNPDP